MPDWKRIVVGGLLVSACGPAQTGVGKPLRNANPTISFICTPMLNLRVRFDATSATVTADGEGPFTLPQVTSRSDFSLYSDGQHVLQISQNSASYGIGRARLQPCSRG
jgi:hypothetical protein